MIIAANQPYLFPYLGYFQLIAGADLFVVYDSMQYVHRSWINRNRLAVHTAPLLVTSPIKKACRFDLINERLYCKDFLKPWIDVLHYNYAHAPYYPAVIELLENLSATDEKNVALFNTLSLHAVCKYIGISTPFVNLSKLNVGMEGDKVDNTIAIVRHFGGTIYRNLPGGRVLYSSDYFAEHGIELQFLEPWLPPYRQQRTLTFNPGLSILDVMMNCSPSAIKEMVEGAKFSR